MLCWICQYDFPSHIITAVAQDMEVDDSSGGQMRSGDDSHLKTDNEQKNVQNEISDVAHT